MALIAIQRKTPRNTPQARSPNQSSAVPADQLAIHEQAAARILQLGQEQTDTAHAVLRIALEGGGCGGFRTRFSWATCALPTDKVFTHGAAQVCIDAKSLKVLGGSTLHWHEELGKEGFRIVTGQKSSSCSCGQSFSLL